MKKYILFLILIFSHAIIWGQSGAIKKIKYAKTEINVPSNYEAKDEYSIENNLFSAQWLYLTEEMVEQGVNKQILKQFEAQMEYDKASDIQFISNGGKLSGKKYLLKDKNKFQYRILAFGAVDGQPLVLNLGFKDDPISNAGLDDLIKQFFQLTK